MPSTVNWKPHHVSQTPVAREGMQDESSQTAGEDLIWKDQWTWPAGSPTQNLDRIYAWRLDLLVRLAWGAWDIHQLVGTVQR